MVLKERDFEFNEAQEKEHTLLKDKFAKQKEENDKRVAKEQEQVTNEENIPELYSPVAILGFSLFFSFIFGGVLMFFNLRKLGKSAIANNVLLICTGIIVVAYFVALKFQVNQFFMLLINLGGGWLLIEFFWKKHVGLQTKFKKKSITKAVLVSVLISVAVFLVTYWVFKDQFPEL